MIFLNELIEFDLINHSYTEKQKSECKKACFHFQSTQNPKSFIHVTVSDKIKVKATTDFLKNGWIAEFANLNQILVYVIKFAKKS